MSGMLYSVYNLTSTAEQCNNVNHLRNFIMIAKYIQSQSILDNCGGSMLKDWARYIVILFGSPYWMIEQGVCCYCCLACRGEIQYGMPGISATTLFGN